MGLFNKKYDYIKDNLELVFNADLKKYELLLNGSSVNYQYLNNKTKKYLVEKNNFLASHSYMVAFEMSKISEKQSKDRRLFLESNGYNCSSFEYLGKNNGTMSPSLEKYLSHLISLNNVLIGINRVGNLPDEYIIDNLLNGILMTSHSGSGVVSNPRLSDNVSYYPDNTVIIKELMYANAYKNSKGSILIKIPDSDLQNSDILISDNTGKIRLNPKYILGYVPVSSNHHIESIITREDILKERRTQNNYYNDDNLEMSKHR